MNWSVEEMGVDCSRAPPKIFERCCDDDDAPKSN
jgi:hypothetical protein